MSENAQAKGRRYLTEGRLIIDLVRGGGRPLIAARARGQGAEYRLGFTDGRWYCTCPARSVCAHLVSLQLVTTTNSTPDGGNC